MKDSQRKAMFAKQRTWKRDGKTYTNAKAFEQDKLLDQYRNLPRSYLGNFPVEHGVKIGQHNVRWYASMIKEPKKKAEFAREAHKLINESKKTALTGHDVARGVTIESLYWKIGKDDKTGSKHGEYLRSLD